ncbi:MAG: sugar phosphate isomerase/epimerase, partial [Chloroflexota bacterium]|nr:sugar phosphate isomerase/epimerase [Chloroflexota bacterium]
MKLALREEMTPGETLAARLSWLERHQIDGIELSGGSLQLPPDEVRQIFAASPIAAANVSGATTLLDADPNVRAAGVDLTRRRLDLAGSLDVAGSVNAAGVLLVPQFGRTPALPDLSPLKTGIELERELLILQLRDLAPAAAAAGVPLFLEPLNRYEAYLVNRVEQGAAIAAEVGSAAEIGVMADFFHMGIEEADIAAAIRAGGERIVHVHLADSNRLQPGRGHLDFRPGFAALKEIGFAGWFGIECRLDGPPETVVPESAALL